MTLSNTSGKAWRTRSWHHTTWTSHQVDHIASWPSSSAKRTWHVQMPLRISLVNYSWLIWLAVSVSPTQLQRIRSRTLFSSRKPLRLISPCSRFAKSSLRWLTTMPRPRREKYHQGAGHPLSSKPRTTCPTVSQNWRPSSSRALAVTVSPWW